MNHNKRCKCYLCFTFIYNFPASLAAGAAIPSYYDYLVVDCDSCVAIPLLAEKGLRGSKMISFDLNVA